MNGQNDKSESNRIGPWLGNITNLAAVFAIAIIIINLFKGVNTLVMLVAFGTLILMVFLRYADVSRFKDTFSQDEAVPPLGLAKGSIRAILAFGILLGFGLYIYCVISRKDVKLDEQIFTALLTILSAVTGFYFGSRGTAVEQTANKLAAPNVNGIETNTAPTISSIEPNEGKSGGKVSITNLTGTGFQANAIVYLTKDDKTILAGNVKVVQANKITCDFNLTGCEAGKYDIVVVNLDEQKYTLPGGFEIVKK